MPQNPQKIVPCDCGSREVYWHGPEGGGGRVYCCDPCWSKHAWNDARGPALRVFLIERKQVIAVAAADEGAALAKAESLQPDEWRLAPNRDDSMTIRCEVFTRWQEPRFSNVTPFGAPHDAATVASLLASPGAPDGETCTEGRQ